MRGVIPCWYNGLYVTPGPLLAAPTGPVLLLGCPSQHSRAASTVHEQDVGSKLVLGLSFKSWSCRGGLYHTTLDHPLEITTASYFSLCGVVQLGCTAQWVIQSPEHKKLSNLVLMSVSGFACAGTCAKVVHFDVFS